MKIFNDSAIYVGGELFSKVIPFLLLPYLTRTLGIEGYGELAYYQTYIALLLVFICLSQEGAIARYYYFYGKRSIGVAIVPALVYSCLVTVIVSLFALYFNLDILLFITISALTQSLLNVQLSLRQCQRQVWSYVIIQIMYSVISVIITIYIFEYIKASAEGRIIAVALSGMIIVFFTILFFIKNNNVKLVFAWNKYRLGLDYILSFGLPLIFHQLNFFLKGQADRIFIYNFFDKESLGIYAASFQISLVLSVIIHAINKAMVPYFFKSLKSGMINKESVLSWFKKSFILIPIPVCASLLMPTEVYSYILGNEYLNVKYFVSLFLFGIALTIPYLILVNFLFYYAQNKSIAKTTMLSAIIYISLVPILSFFGILYVPLGLVISNLIMLSILYVKVVNYNET
ncbi:oligosaccharide flippase family protein [Aliivibrio sp. 1S128]|uniref:oligosaccharide flippase family protein n=1 Tax=Aliivibrio sp. 1S128 TaxID=1840085 RepID=UPI00080DB0F8|nr:oligosaccharide flippase family protein [Aliivibrio sp. 1S128]OCH25518.1 hypothetical protein A6E03_01590 [Aliivibrio sp. 1S128]